MLDEVRSRSERPLGIMNKTFIRVRSEMIKLLAVVVLLSLCATVLSQPGPKRPGTWPAGYWPLEKSQPIIEKTQTIRLSPDLSHLSAGEKAAVAKLLEVGKIFQRIYEDQRHRS